MGVNASGIQGGEHPPQGEQQVAARARFILTQRRTRFARPRWRTLLCGHRQLLLPSELLLHRLHAVCSTLPRMLNRLEDTTATVGGQCVPNSSEMERNSRTLDGCIKFSFVSAEDGFVGPLNAPDVTLYFASTVTDKWSKTRSGPRSDASVVYRSGIQNFISWWGSNDLLLLLRGWLLLWLLAWARFV